jgi:hypothetical protein
MPGGVILLRSSTDPAKTYEARLPRLANRVLTKMADPPSSATSAENPPRSLTNYSAAAPVGCQTPLRMTLPLSAACRILIEMADGLFSSSWRILQPDGFLGITAAAPTHQSRREKLHAVPFVGRTALYGQCIGMLGAGLPQNGRD